VIGLAAVLASTRGRTLEERIGHGEVAINSMAAPLNFTPSIALGKEHLVVALSADVVDAVLHALEEPPEKPAVASADFAEARRRVGVEPGFALAYTRPTRAEDIRALVGLLPMAKPHQMRLSVSRGIPRALRELIGLIDLGRCPSPSTLTQRALSTIVTGWTDEEGIGVASWGTAGISVGAGLAAGAGAIVAMPMIVWQRDKAERAACNQRMTMVLNALSLYAADHGKKFPPRLDDLVPDYLAQPEVFTCPTTGTTYAYVGGLTSGDPSTYVIVYEVDAAHRKGGHVGTVGMQAQWRSNVQWVELQVRRQVERLRAQGRAINVVHPRAEDPAPETVEEFF
jgi:hypothetical protein